jgi:hypothetical protein
MFGDDVVLTRPVNSEPFVEQYTHTLTGVTGTIELNLDYDWSACSIPASWNYNTPTDSPSDGWGALQFIESLEQNGVYVSLLNDEEAPGNSYYYGTDEEGVKGWYVLPTGLTCEDLPECATIISILEDIEALQTEVALKANSADLGATAFSNDYGDLDNLPTIPAAQVNSDWNATSGVAEILNKPTIPSIAGLVPDTRTISTTAPITGGGDLTANRTLSIPQATTLVDGYLSATDWTTFNGKQAALGFTPENAANKQNSLAVDGTGVKFPTVDAVNLRPQIEYKKRVNSTFSDFTGGTDFFFTASAATFVVRPASEIPFRTNQVGAALLSSGASASTALFLTSAGNNFKTLFLGQGKWNFETSILIPVLSIPTSRYRILCGFGDNNGGAFSEADGVFFNYDEGGVTNGNSASPNWRCITSSSSVRTNSNTIPVVANSWTKLRIEVNDDATEVKFFINGTLVATHTTNIPKIQNSQTLMFKQGMAKSTGTINTTMWIDYIGYENFMNTTR